MKKISDVQDDHEKKEEDLKSGLNNLIESMDNNTNSKFIKYEKIRKKSIIKS